LIGVANMFMSTSPNTAFLIVGNMILFVIPGLALLGIGARKKSA